MDKKGVVPVLALGLGTVAGVLSIAILLLVAVFGISGILSLLSFFSLRLAGTIVLVIAGMAIFITRKVDMFTLVMIFLGGFLIILPTVIG